MATTARGARSKRKGSEPAAKPPRRRRTLVVPLLTLVVLSAIYAGALFMLRPTSPGRQLSYDQLTRLAVCAAPSPPEDDASFASFSSYCKGTVAKVATARFLDEDARVVGSTVRYDGSGRAEFWATYPRNGTATNDLLKSLVGAGADVRVDPQSDKALVRFLAQFLLPLVILANLFALVFLLAKGSGRGPSEFLVFGRVGDKRVKAGAARPTTFADVAAVEEAVVELAEVRDYLADPRAFADMGAIPPKGVLLVGPPGCGKTLLARAVAGEADAAFFSISGSEFVESLVGVGAARVRDLFAQARANAPAIVFIDELDAAGRQRGAGVGGGNDEREQTLNELLVQMDGFSPTEGLVVIGATNRADILDPALLRAGRFDRHITVERPDPDGRLAILGLHARSRRLGDVDDLAHIARRTPGFTGADLASVVNEAALLAVRERATTVTRAHLEEAVERVLAGPKKRGRLISAEEKGRVACHEAGHAVVAAALGQAHAVEKVSVIARGRGVGHLAVLSEDKAVLTLGDMERQIAIAMAGIAAEVLVLGEPSTGAEADLSRATETARDMAGRFGMSVRLGRVRVLVPEREVFLGRDYLSTKDVSQPTLEHLDAEVRRILDEQESRARAILEADRHVLDAVATQLVTHETLEGQALAALLSEVAPYPVAAAQNGSGRPARPRRSTRA